MLEKNLPVASGIGGGSSDAAAALKALAELWGASFDAPALARFGAPLGADVPVCLAGKTSWLGGIGEEIAPAPKLPPAWLVLVNPGKALPTAAVFKARRGPYRLRRASSARRRARPPWPRCSNRAATA